MLEKVRPYRGGQEAPPGTYWNAHSGGYVTVAAGALPPGEGIYVRAHPLLVLAVGSLMGMMFVLFLPLAVPLVVGRGIYRRLRGTEDEPPSEPPFERPFRRPRGRPCPTEAVERRLPVGGSH